MRSALIRPWLAFLLLLAVFCSSPIGSVEQPSWGADGTAASVGPGGPGVAPSATPRVHARDGPLARERSVPPELPHGWARAAPRSPAVRRILPPPPPPYFFYDALAPPRA